jgi:hypothetical protein
MDKLPRIFGHIACRLSTAIRNVCDLVQLRIAWIGEPDVRGTPDAAIAAWIESALGDWCGTLFVGPECRGVGLIVGEALALRHEGPVFDGMDRVVMAEGEVRVSGMRHEGRTRFIAKTSPRSSSTLIARAELATDGLPTPTGASYGGRLGGLPILGGGAMVEAIRAAQSELGTASLADAEFIIDVGYGVGSRDGLELVVEPIKAALERLGVKKVMVGASRKVTLDLGILPDELQIGQTGVSVDPRVILALGISGAPQHMNYIGERAVIFAFNRDPDAPIFAFNRSRAKPVVLPVPGDLFVEVPKFLRALEASLTVPV